MVCFLCNIYGLCINQSISNINGLRYCMSPWRDCKYCYVGRQFMKKVVPVAWRCFRLKIFFIKNGRKYYTNEFGRIIKVARESIAFNDSFMCDCGKFVRGNSKYHKILGSAKRNCYVFPQSHKTKKMLVILT